MESDMTRKHFIVMAAITAGISNPTTRATVAVEQAAYFATLNDNFDKALYLKACGVEGF